MGNQFNISSELERLRNDYERVTGELPFAHFYCPILLSDENVELCAGHVINESIPKTARTCVVQRKDIDGFFGSLVEDSFATAVKINGGRVREILENVELRRKVPYSVSVEGKLVECYEVNGHSAISHPVVGLENDSGQFLKLALKMSADEIPETAHLRIAVERDYTPEAVATLLKAAHLTMFAVFGYQYVFSAAGLDVARVLREFYLLNRHLPRKDQIASMKTYFPQFAGMIIPLGGYQDGIVSGSIKDRRFIVCVGSSGHFYSLGVLVKTGDQMSVVLLAPDRAEVMDTYISFTKERWKNPFRYHLADFVDATFSHQAHWKGYKNLYTFDPGKPLAD